MRETLVNVALSLAAIMVASIGGAAQGRAQLGTLEVNGRTGEASVIRSGGYTFVEVGGLAQIANGSLSFRGTQIILILPGGNAGAVSQPAPELVVAATPTNPNALSREFMKAG